MDVIQKKVDIEKLYGDVCVIIENARENAYRTINVQLTLRNWLVGERVAKEDLQGEERATYGKQIVADLSKKLTEHYGAGFDRVSIYNYIRFYRMFPEIVDAVSQQSRDREKIVDAVRQQLLPWTHYRELIREENAEARKWYEQECLRENWSSRMNLERHVVPLEPHRRCIERPKDIEPLLRSS